MDNIRILHLFMGYLPTTLNWAFHMINHLPETEVVIASKRFLRCNFYAEEFTYMKFPLQYVENPSGSLLLTLVNKCLFEIYLWYVQRRCGSCNLMHSHFAQTGWQFLRVGERLHIPYVVSFYGVDYECRPMQNPVWRKRYQQLFQKADLFLCEGAHGTKILRKIGCPEEKIRIARLGVNVSEIPFWQRTKKQEELHLIQIASFTRKKGHTYTIEAFKQALPDCPNMTLTFVGGDRQGIKSQLQAQIQNTPAEEKTVFLEAIDFHQLHDFMKEYQVFIHPSCYTDEMDCEGGAPVVLLDAQATGMPVISTTHCDIPDEVVHGKTGVLTPEKDIGALTNSIRKFYTMDQNEYGRFAYHAREHVNEHFDTQKNARTLKEIYIKLVKNFLA